MNKIIFFILLILTVPGCIQFKKNEKRIPVAKVSDVILYYDQIPDLVRQGALESDSISVIQNYINKWAKKELVYQRAKDNLSADLKTSIERQLDETRANLVIYQYQRQMMLEKMDTVIAEEEIESYYNANSNSFILSSNIVKALFIKILVEAPNIYRIKLLTRSNHQTNLQELESYCFQFAEKFDDFGENWITMDRLSVELQDEIENQESFLKRNTYFETTDSNSVYLLSIRDYRLRSSIAPYEYVKEDIKRIILNNRRFDFIQALENGIYNEALKENSFKIF